MSLRPDRSLPTRPAAILAGAATRSDAQILCVLIGGESGDPGGGAAATWARAALARFGSVGRVLYAGGRQLAALPGFEPGHLARLRAARELLERALHERIERGPLLSSPEAVGQYLQLKLGGRPHEVFAALFLDAQHRLLGFEELFRGTLTQTAVYPREVVKCALAHNAAGVILAHNHPSGTTEPSHADELLTRTLSDALGLIDVRVLDHIIVAHGASLSFAQRGLI
jgi:DNA repair protein RadC